MSGVRLTLVSNAALEHLYLDRAQLSAAMADLGQIEHGMTLAAYGGSGFDFPDRRPSELATLIERAIAGLESR